jgi:Pyridoxamine 5'-phosphate oxidase
MARIEGVCREVCNATEWVAIVTHGADGPHLAGHWNGYMFLDVEDEVVVFPVGRFDRTGRNLRENGRIQLLAASKKVQGSKGPGQGCEIRGTGAIVASGKYVDAVRAKFPWARGALVVRVEETRTQL